MLRRWVAMLAVAGCADGTSTIHLTVDSTRAGLSPPGDDGWQVSYRFRY